MRNRKEKIKKGKSKKGVITDGVCSCGNKPRSWYRSPGGGSIPVVAESCGCREKGDNVSS